MFGQKAEGMSHWMSLKLCRFPGHELTPNVRITNQECQLFDCKVQLLLEWSDKGALTIRLWVQLFLEWSESGVPIIRLWRSVVSRMIRIRSSNHSTARFSYFSNDRNQECQSFDCEVQLFLEWSESGVLIIRLWGSVISRMIGIRSVNHSTVRFSYFSNDRNQECQSFDCAVQLIFELWESGLPTIRLWSSVVSRTIRTCEFTAAVSFFMQMGMTKIRNSSPHFYITANWCVA
jgi:hypothetical protein